MVETNKTETKKVKVIVKDISEKPKTFNVEVEETPTKEEKFTVTIEEKKI